MSHSSRKTNVLSYARESDPGSAARGEHLGQWQRSREKAAQNNEAIIEEVLEVMSGVLIETRAVFFECLARVQRGEADAIRIDRPDRLGRGDTQAILKYEARRAGVELRFNAPQPDADTDEGLLASLFDQLTSGAERIKIKTRFVQAKWARARAGRVVATGKLLYGWRAMAVRDDKGRRIDTRVELVDDQIEVVRRMVARVMAGCSVRSLTKELEAEGVVAPSGGAYWHPSSVKVILSSTMLKGVWQFGRRIVTRSESGGKKRVKWSKRDASEIVTVAVPGIMSPPEWNELQRRLAINPKAAKRPRQVHFYLLRGLMRCALCGRSITAGSGVQNGKLYRWYRCNGMSEHGTHKCIGGRVDAPTLDALVWDEFVKTISTPINAARVAGSEVRERKDFAPAIKAAEDREAAAKRKHDRILRDRMSREDDDPAIESLSTLEAEALRTWRAATDSLNDLRAQQSAATENARYLVARDKLRAAMAAHAANATDSARRALFENGITSALWDGQTKTLAISSKVGDFTVCVERR